MHAPLFTAPVLLVEQPHQLHENEGHYEVLDEQGHPLAFVNEHMMPWRGHRPHQPHRFTIYDPHGYPLLHLDKPWERGRPYIHVSGPHGEPYGSIVQDRNFMGSRFRLNDARGHRVAEIHGDWNGWDFTITDSAGIEIARVSKEHPGLNSGFFTTEDRYALEFAYDLPWPLRRLVLGAAITIDVLLHEREPEFYHSHYADFRRYPEYGYQPRHHWHHPRRGYVVDRRRRRPLLPVGRFGPVRRTTRHVPLWERAAPVRTPYRAYSSRSSRAQTPSAGARSAPAARRTSRPTRHGGASGASRSRRTFGPSSRQESAAASGGVTRRARSERRRPNAGGTPSRSRVGGAARRTGDGSARASGASARRSSSGGSSSRSSSARKSFGTAARSTGKRLGSSRATGGSTRRSSSGGSSRRSSGGRGGSSRRSGGRSRR